MQHRDIPDGERHEPKGISTATPGQVYVAIGGGTGEWRDSLAPVYGELFADSMIVEYDEEEGEAPGDFLPFKSLSKGANKDVTVMSEEGKFLIDKEGTYLVSMNCTHKLLIEGEPVGGEGNLPVLSIRYLLNGTPSERALKSSTCPKEFRNISGSSIISLEEGDSLVFECSVSVGEAIEFSGMDITILEIK